MGADVFISYAGEDADPYLMKFVKELTGDLNRLRLTVFFDEQAIRRGQLWKEELMDALEHGQDHHPSALAQLLCQRLVPEGVGVLSPPRAASGLDEAGHLGSFRRGERAGGAQSEAM